MGPLFVGQNPSGKHPGADWNNNATFARIFEWCDRMDVRYFSFVNISHKEGMFDRGTIDAQFLMFTLNNNKGPVIGLGREVCQVLQKTGVSFFRAPHPSPLNRLLNDKEFETMMLDSMKQFISL